jgi:hypothetical protein
MRSRAHANRKQKVRGEGEKNEACLVFVCLVFEGFQIDLSENGGQIFCWSFGCVCAHCVENKTEKKVRKQSLRCFLLNAYSHGKYTTAEGLWQARSKQNTIARATAHFF